jgi:hypothetical protein
MAKSYAVNVPGSEVKVVDAAAKHCLLQVRSLPYFLDCHHVGAFEGVLRYAGVEGQVRLRMLSPQDADFLVTWK